MVHSTALMVMFPKEAGWLQFLCGNLYSLFWHGNPNLTL